MPPQEKRKPPGFPSFDPIWFMLPLFDAYAGPSRTQHLNNPRMHPTLAQLQDLPANLLFVIPTSDFLLYEQLDMVKRLQREASEEIRGALPASDARRIEKLLFEGQLHGWLECVFHSRGPSGKVFLADTDQNPVPSWAIDESTRRKAFASACEFLIDVHRRYGFDIRQTAP